MVFLKDFFFLKLILKKIQTTKKHAKLPSMLRVNVAHISLPFKTGMVKKDTFYTMICVWHNNILALHIFIILVTAFSSFQSPSFISENKVTETSISQRFREDNYLMVLPTFEEGVLF